VISLEGKGIVKRLLVWMTDSSTTAEFISAYAILLNYQANGLMVEKEMFNITYESRNVLIAPSISSLYGRQPTRNAGPAMRNDMLNGRHIWSRLMASLELGAQLVVIR
jgi:hypothetical protein